MGFFSDILGKTGAKAAEQAAGLQAEASERAAEEREDFARKGMQRSIGYLSPFAQSGASANTLLSDLIGLNGPEAARSAYQSFVAPPGFQEAVDFGTQTAMQSGINFGNLRSGATMKALQDVGQRSMYGATQDWLNRLTDQQGRGINIAGEQAGITERGYTNIGEAKAGGILGSAGARASGIVGAANARAQGSQNLLNMGVSLAAAAMGMPGGGNLFKGGSSNNLLRASVPSTWNTQVSYG